MPIPIDLLSSYSLNQIRNYVSPVPMFFRDRYFQTGPKDIFTTDYVLLERKQDSRRMADFVAKRVGDIPIDRDGYEIFSYRPPKVAPSRLITADMLEERSFGEALYGNLTPEQRAVRLLADDEQELERVVAFREEWMAVQMMLGNGFSGTEMIDDVTPGESFDLKYYDGLTSPHVYTPGAGTKWGASSTFAGVSAQITAMCNTLLKRGCRASDLILGSEAAEVFCGLTGLMDRIDKNSGYITGELREQITAYQGVRLLGALNFGGHILTIFVPETTYTAKNGTETLFFPAKGIMVTAPKVARMMYAAVTQIDRGGENFSTHAATRVYKTIVDEKNDERKLRVTARPLPVPDADAPYMVCDNILAE